MECCARPRLDIVQPLPESCEEISSDALTVRGFQENECRDYHLGRYFQYSFVLFSDLLKKDLGVLSLLFHFYVIFLSSL